MPNPPQILFIGGHDPVGGAGLQADIETAQAHGCRCYSLVTTLTTQDSGNIQDLHPQPAAALRAQLKCLLGDVQPDMVKIGLIGSTQIARVLAEELAGLPQVIDPVLAAGGGRDVADETLLALVRECLLPRAVLLTPNRTEARRLTGEADPVTAARALLETECGAVLLTGADEAGSGRVTNLLIERSGETAFTHPLLPHRYHGSGCTLAAACACNLALGLSMQTAVGRALDWTWQTLRQAEHPGRGQYLPNRRSASP